MSFLQPSWSRIHDFILPGCAERPPRSLPRAVRLLMVFTILLNLAMLPVFECPRRPDHNCREDYDQRMRAASAPWATPDQADAIRDWAVKNGCNYCKNTGRMSRITWWWEFLKHWH
jgi:hypothetical protein